MTLLTKQNDSLCINSTHQSESSASVTKHLTQFLTYTTFVYLPLHLPAEITLPLLKQQVSCAICRRIKQSRLHCNEWLRENGAMMLKGEKFKYWDKHHHSQTPSTINPTWFDLQSRWVASYYDGLTADTAVRPVCLSADALSSESQCYSHRSTTAATRASSHGAGRRRTATWCKGDSQCLLNQTANGALRDVAQTRHGRSLLSERHRFSQHKSQYKQTNKHNFQCAIYISCR